jgi:phosphodiesterase/alkaline phosphatase D-like protein
MPLDNTRRDFIRNSATLLTAASATGLLSACGSSHDRPAQADYLYGVASGDPLTDRVILWTHARAGNLDTAIALSWQVASDAEFRQIVSAGQVSATADTGFTAKVDAGGLTAGSRYYYRFIDASGKASPVGVTRTLPTADVSSVKFAVFSCAIYSEGFFNAYDAAARSDADYALHLGDYIYEYGAYRRRGTQPCHGPRPRHREPRRLPYPLRPLPLGRQSPGRARPHALHRHLGRPRVCQQCLRDRRRKPRQHHPGRLGHTQSQRRTGISRVAAHP